MNERIRELLEQASEYAHENRAGDWEVGPAYQDIFNEKFAELIVRECAKEIMYSSVGQEDPVFAYEYVKHLKTTFSIAE